MTTSPESGLDPHRWQRAAALCRELCETDVLPAVGVALGRGEGPVTTLRLGRQGPEADAEPVRDDAMFLVASITKPLVAMGALLLAERGRLSLTERVMEYLPEFGVNSKVPITIAHLLTHTSGLPDMLPNNVKLRTAHAPLSEFVNGACAVTRDFPAGHAVQYQSMGFAVLGAIIETISGQTCRDFLRNEFFEPLGMTSTSLGAPDAWFDGPQPFVDRIAGIRLPEQQHGTDWHWNSRYWRGLGAPWGGLLTTPEDLGKYAQMMLREGRGSEPAVLSPATVAAATRNQLAAYGGVPEEDRRCRPWGYGWRLQWPAHSASFGALIGPQAYGHWGATGTMLWIDPERDAFAAILSTQPLGKRDAALIRISNALAACFR